jgi:hypothetical protein
VGGWVRVKAGLRDYFTKFKYSYPRTPISMETIEMLTHSEATKLGIKMRAMIIITTAVARIAWMVCGKIAKY